ncbi:MAG: oligosaccharide flippase family protein, partial [Ruminiclostridium sp.]|nr:oligosaccharide flippase family protein [Ruminiclostridium sp.]
MSVKKSFIRNTAVMFIAMFISKGLGAVLKIPLGNILGGEGMGYFTTAYSIFTPVLSFACAGIPTILTRMVAEYAAAGEHGKIRNARRCSLFMALMLGLAGTALIYAAAVPFVCFIANSPESLAGVLLIAPATVFCSVTAVYRGYYEGLSDTLPTAVSQVIEAFVKAFLGVGLSWFVYANGVR